MNVGTTGSGGLSGIPDSTTTSSHASHTEQVPSTAFFDSLTPFAQESLNVNISSITPSNGLSIVEYTKIVSAVIQELKQTLVQDNFVKLELERKLYLTIVDSTGSLLDLLNQVIQQTLAWNDPETGQVVTVAQAYAQLQQQFADYNAQVSAVAIQDQAAISLLNQAYIDYKNGTIDQAALDQAVQTFNNYRDNRPNLQTYIDQLVSRVNTYNSNIDSVNAQITQINNARAARTPPLAPYDLLKKVNPIPAPSPLYTSINSAESLGTQPPSVTQWLGVYNQPVSDTGTEALRTALKNAANPAEYAAIDLAISNAQQNQYDNEEGFFTEVKNQLSSLLPVTGATIFNTAIFNVPVLEPPVSNADIGKIAVNATYPNPPGTVPQLTLSDLMGVSYLPVAIPLLQLIMLLKNSLDSNSYWADVQRKYFQNSARTLTFPAKYIEKANNIFLRDPGATGGVGMGSFTLGTHTRDLEAVLSRAVLQGLASDHNLPLSGRVLSRLQFSAIDLLSKSALLGSMPAASILADRLGVLGAQSPVIELAASIGFSSRLQNVVDGNVTRSIANGTVNQIAFGSRANLDIAKNGQAAAELALQDALKSGDNVKIGDALNQLVQAEITLNGAIDLSNTFGKATIGGLSLFTAPAAATMNLSLLTVGLAEVGKALGMPNLVPQVFANFSGLPTADITAAMNTQAGVGGVLGNPVSVLTLKENLSDKLQNRGYSSPDSADIANNAVNNVVLKGDVNTLSYLQAEFFQAFRDQGVGQLDSHALSNQAAAAVRGDLGSQLQYAAYGLDFSPAYIGSSVANSVQNVDTGRSDLNAVLSREFSNPNLAGLLTGAIDSSVSSGGFETQSQFRDSLASNLGASGLSTTAATFLANSSAVFGSGGGLASPFGVPADQVAALESNLVDSIIRELKASIEQAKEIVAEALHHALVRAPFSNAVDLNTILKEEVVRAAQNRGLSGASVAYDHSIAAFAGGGVISSVPGLVEQIGSTVVGLSKPELGARHAQELKDAVLNAVLGGTNQQEIEENKNPSYANLIAQQVSKLTESDDQAEYEATVRKLVNMLESVLRPSEGVGTMITSLMEHPTTFITSVAQAASQGKQNLDIPV